MTEKRDTQSLLTQDLAPHRAEGRWPPPPAWRWRRASCATRRRRARRRSRSASRRTAPASAPPTAAGTSAPPTPRSRLINDAGGINGRPVEIIVEDDGTDPKRGAEVVEKFATQHKIDVVFGTLFSHVVDRLGAGGRRAEDPLLRGQRGPSRRLGQAEPLRLPARHHRCASARSISMAPWVAANVGKKVTHDLPGLRLRLRPSRLPAAGAQGAGRRGDRADPHPADGKLVHRYFPQIPADTDVIYHVMVGPAVLTFVKELGEFYGSNRPQLFGFIDSLEAVDINSPGLEFLEGTHFWEGSPRYLQATPAECAEVLSRRGRHRRQRRSGQRRQGRLDRLAHVRLLGDALRHQAGDGGGRLPGRRPTAPS